MSEIEVLSLTLSDSNDVVLVTLGRQLTRVDDRSSSILIKADILLLLLFLCNFNRFSGLVVKERHVELFDALIRLHLHSVFNQSNQG